MRTSHKLALTILISLLLTGAFAVLAYTGLFRVLETDFFSARVKTDQLQRIQVIAEDITAWNGSIISRFEALSRERHFQASYSTNQTESEILNRSRSIDALKDNLDGFDNLRVIDADGRIQYSSNAGDYSESFLATDSAGEQQSRRVYQNWNLQNDFFELPAVSEESVPQIRFDGATQRIVYLIPSTGNDTAIRGWMLVSMASYGLGDRLTADGLSAPGGLVRIISDRGVIIDIRADQADSVKSIVDKLWSKTENVFSEPGESGVSNEKDKIDNFSVLADLTDETFWLVSIIAEDGTWVGKPIPGSLLGLTSLVQILVLATFFISITLLLFLILNFRVDPTEILRGRMKKLQVNLIRDWLEHHDDRKLKFKDLEDRREEVKQELLNGLGGMKGPRLEKANKMIDEGWTRIIDILTENESSGDLGIAESTVSTQSPIDMKQLEDMITRAVSDAVPREALRNIQSQSVMAPITPGRGGLDTLEVIESTGPVSYSKPFDVEEVEELDDFDDLETLDDLEDLEELGDSEVTSLGEPVEVEELEELGDLDVESLGEPVEVEELEELGDLDVASLGEPVEVEELEELIESVDPLLEIGPLATIEEEVEDLESILDLSVPDTGFTRSDDADESGTGFIDESADNVEDLALLEEPEELEPIDKPDEEVDVLEVLPVVLSDDTRELIEIDQVDQDRMYMFDNKFESSKNTRKIQDESAELQELEGSVDDVEDFEELDDLDEVDADDGLEELEDLEELDDIEEADAVDPLADNTEVIFISIDSILDNLRIGDTEITAASEPVSQDSVSMETLIQTRTTGILPGMDQMEDEFLFDDETPILTWSSEGLDYDRYLKGFKKGATGVYKSLMTLSKDYTAICGVMLAGSRKGLETDYAVGLDDESATHLSVTRNEDVWDEWFAGRDAVFVPDLSGSHYAEKTSHNEFRFIKAGLFMPATYHGTQAYIFLGFKDVPSNPMALLLNVESVK